MTSPRSVELRGIAQAIADALRPAAEEVVVTGSVSRGVADDVSDVEILIVTPRRRDRERHRVAQLGSARTGGKSGSATIPTSSRPRGSRTPR